MDFEELLYEYLIPRADWIFEHYTQLPAELPYRVGAMARYITQDAQNDFERAVMVAEFLRNEFDYTLTPGNTPADRDFVDWFLFDLQTGYCVHFATAFVVMMRSLGIPARYVEGFMASGSVGSDGFMDVINRQGHAWGEVYFEGFGWYLFEPTPAGAVFSWSTTTVEPVIPAWNIDRDITFQSPFVEGGEDWEAMGTEPPPATQNIDTTDIGGEYYEIVAPPAFAQPQPMSMGRLIALSAYVVGAIALAYLALRVVLGILRQKRLRRRDNNTAVEAHFKKILKYLSYFNYAPYENDTPLEFAQKISRRMGFENESIFMEDIAYIYYRAQYSHRPITDEERDTMEKALVQMELRLQNYVGKERFWFYKYVAAALS